MNRRIFFWNIMARVGLLITTVFLFIWLAETLLVEFLFTIVLGTFLITLQVFLLTRYVLGITRVIEQFVDAIGREETPEIQFGTGKALFRKLKERSNAINQAMNARRLEKEKDDRILIHVMDSADLGLFCFDQKGELLFANESARGLISNKELHQLNDLKMLNRKLWQAMTELKPGSPRVVSLYREQDKKDARRSEQLISVRLKKLKIFDEQYSLFSLQNIQEELHKNESDSWQKIIRVLTHEIMNAVAPMLSLSKSLRKRVNPADGEEAGKLMDGLQMIESTGKGLMDFIEEYRRLSLLPPPKKEKLRLADALEGIMILFEDEARERDSKLSMELEETGLEIHADPHQFEMILLNLMRNAFDSLPEGKQGNEVWIHARSIEKGAEITVGDNGTGIKEDLLDQVFVPFFSTKENGSGIGLSLIRQIMNKHDGSIALDSAEGKGTLVTLLFS